MKEKPSREKAPTDLQLMMQERAPEDYQLMVLLKQTLTLPSILYGIDGEKNEEQCDSVSSFYGNLIICKQEEVQKLKLATLMKEAMNESSKKVRAKTKAKTKAKANARAVEYKKITETLDQHVRQLVADLVLYYKRNKESVNDLIIEILKHEMVQLQNNESDVKKKAGAFKNILSKSDDEKVVVDIKIIVDNYLSKEQDGNEENAFKSGVVGTMFRYSPDTVLRGPGKPANTNRRSPRIKGLGNDLNQ